MARGFKWVEYGNITGIVSGFITSHTYVTNPALSSLELGTLNRQPFNSSSSRKYFGLIFYGFQPSNLRISIKKPLADCFTTGTTGLGSVSEFGKNLFMNGFDFRAFNYNAPTFAELNPVVGVSTLNIPGYVGYGTTASFAVGIAPTYFNIPYSFDASHTIGIGSRLLVRWQNDPTQNGIYTVYTYNPTGPNGQPIMTLVHSGDYGPIFTDKYHLRVKLISNSGINTTLGEYYGAYWSNDPSNLVGLNTELWYPQSSNLYLGPVKIMVQNNYNLTQFPNNLQNIILNLQDSILVGGQTDSTQNGIYQVSGITTVGLGTTVVQLKRVGIVTDNLSPGQYAYVQSGIYSGYYYMTQFLLGTMGTYAAAGFAYSHLNVGYSSIYFQCVNQFTTMSTDSPSSWAPMPVGYATTLFYFGSTSITNYQPLILNTVQAVNNPNIFYSDIIGFSIRIPAWQQDSSISGLNINVDFDIQS